MELTCDFDSYKKQNHNTPEDCSLFQLYKVYIPCHITNICTYLLLANDHNKRKKKTLLTKTATSSDNMLLL